MFIYLLNKKTNDAKQFRPTDPKVNYYKQRGYRQITRGHYLALRKPAQLPDEIEETVDDLGVLDIPEIPDFEAMKKPELQDLCASLGLEIDGLKSELIERLKAHYGSD